MSRRVPVAASLNQGLGLRPPSRYNGLSFGTMGYDEQRWILKALREAAHEIEGQVFGLGDEELRRRVSEDQLSLKETLLHLRDAEEVYVQWLQLIVQGGEAELPDIDVEDFPLERDYQSADLYEALMTFADLRSRTSYLLWSLSPDEWERAGRHPIRGPLTVQQLAREMNEHDLEHLWQMRRLRQAVQDDQGE